MHRHHSLLSILLVLGGVVALTGSLVASAEPETPARTGSENAAREFIAYYFHGNVRCATCRTIEEYSKEAIATGFADSLASGRMTWRVINVDEPENKHFIQDFELVTKTLVVAEYRDGTVIRWQNLDRVWRLVGNKEAFVDYVHDEIDEFIGES